MMIWKVKSWLVSDANRTVQDVDGAENGPTGPTSTRSPKFARKKVGRLGVLISALLLALTAVAIPASSPPAVALEDNACTPSAPNALDNWELVRDDHGVTVCAANWDDDAEDALVQIVDLSAGAQIQILSDRVDPWEVATATNQYEKRNIIDWWNYLRFDFPGIYPNERLVSTTNASFFINTSLDPSTALSMPERANQGGPAAHTLGYAFADHGDAAWDRGKRVLRITGSANVQLTGFPTHYTESDVYNTFIPAWKGTVGFGPFEGDTESESRRTFVGVSPVSGTTKVYILSTAVDMNLGEARHILETFGSDLEMQLDGGASTQTALNQSPYGFDSYIPLIGRKVPDVIAVYEAP